MKYAKHLKVASLLTGAAVLVFALVTLYYYVTTPSTAVIVSVDEFPQQLSLLFTPDTVIDRATAHLNDMVLTANAEEGDSLAQQEGLAPRVAAELLIPTGTLSHAPSPVFSQKWKGWNLELARQFGMSLKARRFLELEVLGVQRGGWRITAFLKERPTFSAQSAGSAPLGGGPCSDMETCVNELSEQALRLLDSRRFLAYEIKVGTDSAKRAVLNIYANTIPASSVGSEDLVAWGNAYYGLHRYGEALQKYQEALDKDHSFCPGLVARGLVYYSRPHGSDILQDLNRAESDFRAASVCAPQNALAQTDLCSTLIRKWRNSTPPNSQFLADASTHCDSALSINPHFVSAAVNKAYVLYRQGQRQGALQYFDELSQRYPLNGAVFLNYGFFLYLDYLAGDEPALRKAAEKTQQSWDLDQNSYVAADNLAFFYYEIGDYRRAIEFWKKAKVLNNSEPDCAAGLALGLFRINQPEEAVASLTDAIDLDSRYRDPTYLETNADWSPRAASDLALVMKLLPAKTHQ